MSRLKRKNREDIRYASSGGLGDLFDNQMKSMLRINDDEYDFILERCIEREKSNFEEDELMNLMVANKLNFSQKCRLLILIDEALEEYNNQE